MPNYRVVHGPELHRRAFEIYYREKNKSAAARECGVSYVTINSWAEREHHCRFGCPWHGWDDLVEEKEKALAARLQLHAEGVYDPVEQEKSIKEVIDNPTAPRVFAIDDMLHTDLERIGHYEYLYEKIFYHLTGIPLSVEVSKMVDLTPEQHNKEVGRVAETLNRGLLITNFESGLRCLNDIVTKIKELKKDAGAIKDDDESGEPKTLKIEDLRKLKQHLDKMPSVQAQKLVSQALLESETINEAV